MSRQTMPPPASRTISPHPPASSARTGVPNANDSTTAVRSFRRERRHDRRGRARVERRQRRLSTAPANRTLTLRELVGQRLPRIAVARDRQLEPGQPREQLDERAHALRRGDPADVEESRPRGRRHLGTVEARVEREHLDRTVDAAFPMPARGPAARREQHVDVRERTRQRVAVSPELRRTTRAQAARKARRAVAGAFAVLPEDVGRADEPMVVQRQELRAGARHAEHGRPADQRDVVVVDDVEAAVENGRERRPDRAGRARLVPPERRPPPERASEPMDDDAAFVVAVPGFAGGPRARAPAGRDVGVLRADHLDVVACARERARQRPHVDRVPAEMARRIERRDHAEAHRDSFRSTTDRLREVGSPGAGIMPEPGSVHFRLRDPRRKREKGASCPGWGPSGLPP
jgi:hypothetical protein